MKKGGVTGVEEILFLGERKEKILDLVFNSVRGEQGEVCQGSAEVKGWQAQKTWNSSLRIPSGALVNSECRVARTFQ